MAGSIGYDTVLIHTVPEYYPQWIDREHAAGKRVLGYTVWELERLPDHWPAILNQLDKGDRPPAAGTSTCFRNSVVTVPLHVVPHLSQFGVTRRSVPPIARRLDARIGPDGDGLRLLHDRLLVEPQGALSWWSTAYLRAFTAADPVTMIVKANARDNITRYIRSWCRASSAAARRALKHGRSTRLPGASRAPRGCR